MHNLLKIITEPDNIAILIMLVSVTTCTLMAFREIWINDRLIKSDQKSKVYERMAK